MEPKFGEQVLVQGILCRLNLVKKFHNLFFPCVRGLVLLFGFFDNLVGELAVTAHKLVSHLLELLLFCLELFLDLLESVLALHDYLRQEKASVNVRLLESAEGVVGGLKLD